MAVEFNFNKLESIYRTTLRSDVKMVAFDVRVGKGQFLFMMFLSAEDEDAKDNLFIYLRNTEDFIKLKMYGSHRKGDFKVYIEDLDKAKMICELQLKPSNGTFDFITFLNELNSRIPLEISNEDTLNNLRRNSKIINSLNPVDDCDKTVLVGIKKLTHGKPREKTLRKLYLHTNGCHKSIAELIGLLKNANCTVAWTTEDRRSEAANISDLLMTFQ